MKTLAITSWALEVDRIAEQYGYEVPQPQTLRIKEAGDHYIDLCRMTFNWRLVTTPIDCPWIYDRGWCYLGRHGFMVAHEEALKWPADESRNYNPGRWYKAVHTQETRQEFFFTV